MRSILAGGLMGCVPKLRCSIGIAILMVVASCASASDSVPPRGATNDDASSTSGSTEQTIVDEEPLALTGRWVLQSVNGVEYAAGNVRIRFSAGAMTGTAYCNRISGDYVADGSGMFELVSGESELEDCGERDNSRARALWDALGLVHEWEIEGGTLLMGPPASGSIVLVRN